MGWRLCGPLRWAYRLKFYGESSGVGLLSMPLVVLASRLISTLPVCLSSGCLGSLLGRLLEIAYSLHFRVHLVGTRSF